VSAQAQRLKVSRSDIDGAGRCGCFPEAIESCGGNLAFVAMISGRTPKIVRRGLYDGREPVTKWASMVLTAAAQAQQRAQQRRKPPRKAA
jgi:hypothetical protein